MASTQIDATGRQFAHCSALISGDFGPKYVLSQPDGALASELGKIDRTLHWFVAVSLRQKAQPNFENFHFPNITHTSPASRPKHPQSTVRVSIMSDNASGGDEVALLRQAAARRAALEQATAQSGSDTEGEAPGAIQFSPLARVPLIDVPAFLENLGVDLAPLRGGRTSRAADPPFLVTFTGSGDPKCKDIRARPLSVVRNPDSEEAVVNKAIAGKHIVFKAGFRCRGYAGICQSPSAKCTMSILVEVKANDINSAMVSVRNRHDPPANVKLKPSKILKQAAYGFFQSARATPSQFQFDVQAKLGDDARLLSKEQLKYLSSRSRKATYGMTYAALAELARNDPDHVRALDLQEGDGDHRPGNSFSYACTDPIGLRWAIRFGHGGVVGMDTSWRGKSKTNSPLTIVSALDPVTRHGKPVAWVYSANIKETTLVSFLQWIVASVKTFAVKVLAQEEGTWHPELRGLGDRLRTCAEGTGWSPRVFLIDKARNELNSIRIVWSNDIIVRICFWHITNAILKWEGSHAEAGSQEELAEARPQDSVVPRSVRKALIRALLTVARSATEPDFHAAKSYLLETEIPAIVEREAVDRTVETRRQIKTAVKRYISMNWVDSPVWLPCFADHLLPADIDLGTVNTTAIMESAFKMIDKVILRGRFHLSVAVHHLRQLWRYVAQQDEAPRLSLANRDAMSKGASYWEQDRVRHLAGSIYEVLRENQTIARVDVDATRQGCNVASCRLPSHPCAHYYACDLYRSNRKYSEWAKKVFRAAEAGEESEVGGQSDEEEERRTVQEEEHQSDQGEDSDELLDDDVNRQIVQEPGSQLSLRQDGSQQSSPQSQISYTPIGATMGLGLKWPKPRQESNGVNFQLGKRLATCTQNFPPAKKATGRRPDPVKGPEAPPNVLRPSKERWADAVGATLPTLIALSDVSRIRNPLPPRFQKAIDKFPDTLKAVLAWWYDGAPLDSVERAFLRDLYSERALRDLRNERTVIGGIEALLNPLDAGQHRRVPVKSDCCTFSPGEIQLPAIFRVPKELDSPGPPLWHLAELGLVSGLRRRCKNRDCDRQVELDWPLRGLNRTIAIIAIEAGNRGRFVIEPAVSIEASDQTSRHSLAAIIYGEGKVARFAGPDGKVSEWDAASGKITSVLGRAGVPVAWGDILPSERVSVHQHAATVVFYVKQPA